MEIQINDYIEGYEHYGDVVRKTKGWVDEIQNDGRYLAFDIQADDEWNGHRGTIIFSHLGEVKKLKPKERIKI